MEWYALRDIESGKKKLTPEIALDIEKKYSISFRWLLTGDGEMFQNSNEEEPTSGIIGEDFSDAFKMMRMFDEKLNEEEVVTILEIMAGLPANRRQEVLEFAKTAKASKVSDEIKKMQKDIHEIRIELDKMKKEKKNERSS